MKTTKAVNLNLPSQMAEDAYSKIMTLLGDDRDDKC